VLVQDTGNSEVILRGVDTTRSDDGSQTRLTAHLLVGGDAAPRLEQLVSRLSLEPGIYGVHWHSADEPDLAPALAVSGEESGPPDEE
jgi:putative Mg2+ transporter-C (MgtC) family protein